MRRDSRKQQNSKKLMNDKTIIYSAIGTGILILVVLGVMIYLNTKKQDTQIGSLGASKLNIISNNTTENTQSASSEMGKTVEESKKENTVNNISQNNNTTKNTTMDTKNTKSNTVIETESKNIKNSKEEQKKELNFIKPVEGEIIKEFAKEQLIYSNTLEEWTTHLGIDIKADETAIVGAAEAGNIKSIKNDPRYGQTVIIEHEDGYQTIYANLLTSEFVVEGEKVEKGQTIGTVGKTGAFEVKDDPHLHFEILKDFEAVDPNMYIN